MLPRVCVPVSWPATRGAADKRTWDRNNLTVGFLSGNAEQHQLVFDVLREISRYCSMNFHVIQNAEDATIRVDFDETKGSYSYVGMDNLLVQGHATMNIGWLDEGVVRHEFGHALGLRHEHRHIRSAIPWDKPKVYEYYARMGWSKADVDRNVLGALTETYTQFSEYDTRSIMHYGVPNELTIGDFEIPWSTEFSTGDKAFLHQLYPFEHSTVMPFVSR